MLFYNHSRARYRFTPGLCGIFFIFPAFSVLLATARETPIFYIREYRVGGSTKLSPLEIQETVYPFLGPARTADDVERARLALEAAFKQKGYETVSVLIPQQDPRYGVIKLDVTEGKVGRLRVNGARWFLPSRIKAAAPSIAEGSVPNLNDTRSEILALNRTGDRRVTPALRPGAEPGTVDIDLNVEDKLPLHGSLEINNRYSADTSRPRLNGSLGYGNLFQRGDTLGGSFQIAPENIDDALVYSGYYLSRINETLSLNLQASKQDSDISTLGGSSAVIGKGETYGIQAIIGLPPQPSFYQNLTFGIDYKNYREETFTFGDTTFTINNSDIKYVPLSASYAATRLGKSTFTAANLTLTLGLRGLGDDESRFNNKRFNARGNFLHLRGDLSHTLDLTNGAQLFAKLQGQLASGPLINNEQFSGGGLGSARGYLEATALGDNGIFATAEYRSPSFTGTPDARGNRKDEWRVHAFIDAGVLGIYDSLPGQDSTSTFTSVGIGTRAKYREHFNASIDLALPLIEQGTTNALDPFLTFRGWADF